jgi:transmembrane sensor
MGKNPIQQKEFRQMLEKYSTGLCTAEEQKLIEKWYEEIGKGNRLLLDDRQHQLIEARMWNNIAPHSLNFQRKNFSYRKMSAVAASLLILATVVFLFFKPSPVIKHESLTTIESDEFQMKFSNEEMISKQISLEDGSIITLQPQSQLLYSKHFKRDKREVKLIGAAFFEIAHDTRRPFLVYTKDVITKVLGTSFTIDAQKDKAITVSVKTGRVSVSRAMQRKGSGQITEEAILIPNQKAVFDLDNDKLMTTLADDPKPVLSNEEIREMNFEEERVPIILRELEKMYGVEISFDETILRSCVLTTVFSDENLYDRLKIICRAIDGTFETQGTKIILQSHGCSN